MADESRLEHVKNALGITSDYQDATLMEYIDEIEAYMKSAGISEDVIASDEANGIVSRGVADMWYYSAGEAGLSDYFQMRLVQLMAESLDSTEDDTDE